MAKLTKKAKALQGKVETTKLYPLGDALALVKTFVPIPFDRDGLLDLLARQLPAGVVRPVEVAQALLGTALVVYVPWYLLKAMLRVYAQSWWKTLPKFGILGLAYFVSLAFTIVGLLAYTALTL